MLAASVPATAPKLQLGPWDPSRLSPTIAEGFGTGGEWESGKARYWTFRWTRMSSGLLIAIIDPCTLDQSRSPACAKNSVRCARRNNSLFMRPRHTSVGLLGDVDLVPLMPATPRAVVGVSLYSHHGRTSMS
jgi:hypothetical protein